MRVKSIYIILLILVLSFAYVVKSNRFNKPTTQSLVTQVPSQSILEEYKKQYRLSPDRRFLKAINLIGNFFGEQSPDTAIATWNRTGWNITYQNKLLGQLPEFPNYSDYMKILTDRAITLNKTRPLKLDLQTPPDPAQDELLSKFFAEDIIPALTMINQSWNEGHHTQATLKNASRGLIYLTIQSLDSMGIGDEVPAQAWAILAAYKSLTGDTLTQEEVLLAEHLSYSKDALTLSNELAPDNPVYSYLQKDISKLQSIKQQGLVQYLVLKSFINMDNVDDALVYLRKELPARWNAIAVLKNLMDANSFAINRNFSNLIPSIVLINVAHITQKPMIDEFKELFIAVLETVIPDSIESNAVKSLRKMLEVDKSGKINQLYAQLEVIKEKVDGPFMTPSYISSFYESFFFSSIYAQGIFYLDQLGSDYQVKEFNEELSGQSEGTAAVFKVWYDILASSQAGKMSLDDIINKIPQFNEISPVQFTRLIEEIKSFANYGEPKLNILIKELCQKLDSRPQNLSVLGNYAFNTLLDLPLAEKLITKAVELYPHGNDYSHVWLASFKSDITKLRKLAALETLTPATRASALTLLRETMGPTNVKIELTMLNQNFPSDFKVAKSLCKFLMKIKNYPETRIVAQAWIDQDKVSVSLERTIMAEIIADSYFEEGLYSEGYRFIEPYITGQKNATFIVAIKLLRKLARNEDAQNLLIKALNRYPDSIKLLCLGLNAAWEEGRYSDAAQLIKRWKRPLNFVDWRWEIGTTFADVFKNKPITSGLKASEELIRAGFSVDNIINIIKEVHSAGNNELAFQLNSTLKITGLQNLEVLTDSYSYLKILSGEQKAKAWFQQNVPPAMQNPLSMFLYSSKYYDLIWDMIDNPESSYGGDFVWLMRTAGWLRAGKQNELHHNKLIHYYQKHNMTFYDKLGRYLLNMETAQNIIGAAGSDLDKFCEYTYYFAIKAEADGKFEEASDWYHVVVSTGQLKEGEYRWAFNRLWEWMSTGKALGHITASTKVHLHN